MVFFAYVWVDLSLRSGAGGSEKKGGRKTGSAEG